MRTPNQRILLALANQGEIRIDKIAKLPDVELKPFTEANEKGFIISHSEQGHHHILTGDVEVMERVTVPKGAKILQVIVNDPSKLWQDAAAPHDTVDLEPGIYEFRTKREWNSFAKQARRVAD